MWTECILRAIRRAPLRSDPFDHLRFDRVFPDDAYRALLDHLPDASSYGELPHKDAMRPDGTSSRLEFPLTQERIGTLDGRRRSFWKPAADALGRPEVKEALSTAFASAVARRRVRRLPETTVRISLLRDLTGYKIRPHQDIPLKLFTMQLYLPLQPGNEHLGTTFYRVGREGRRLERAVTLPFRPNSGYAFAVTADSWHGVDRISFIKGGGAQFADADLVP